MPRGGMKSNTGWWKVEPTAERLRELLSYDASTGEFVWLRSRRGISAGKVAGCVSSDLGYRLICVDGLRYYAHRLAWLHQYGEWPKEEIDHVNGDRADNSISNLREATRQQNRWNCATRRESKSRITGVSLLPYGKWRARIRGERGESRHLGVFDTSDEASTAYMEAARARSNVFVRDKG